MLLFLYFINFNYVMSETTDQRCPEKKKKRKCHGNFGKSKAL